MSALYVFSPPHRAGTGSVLNRCDTSCSLALVRTPFDKRCSRNAELVTNRLGNRTQTPTPGSPASPAERRDAGLIIPPTDLWQSETRRAGCVETRLSGSTEAVASKAHPPSVNEGSEINPQLLSDDRPTAKRNRGDLDRLVSTDLCDGVMDASRHA